MSRLHTDQLTLAYEQAVIITDMNIEIPSGRITALVGPNGCGKSTLLRGLARLLNPRGGTTYLDGKAIHRIPTRTLAQMLGILPQSPVAPEGLTVRELVAQGRYPHQAWFQQWAAEDESAVSKALSITGMADLADRARRRALGRAASARLDRHDAGAGDRGHPARASRRRSWTWRTRSRC